MLVRGDPLTDGGPWRVDGLESLEVEWGIGRWGMLTRPSQSPWRRRKSSTEVSEQVAAFSEDRAKDFRDGEDELTVGNGQADVVGEPTGGLESPALVAGGTEVAGFAAEGEQVLVTAAGADEAGEAGGKVPATAEGLDGDDGFRTERAHGGAEWLS